MKQYNLNEQTPCSEFLRFGILSSYNIKSNIRPQMNENARMEQQEVIANGDNQVGSSANMINEVPTKKNEVRVASVPRSVLETGDKLKIDVSEFFAKPEILVNGFFAAGDGPATFPNYTCEVGFNSFALKQNKISGALGVRFDTVVTLQVNANRMQQGRYILAHLPTGGVQESPSSTSTYASWIRAHRFSKSQITQLPHVEIDVNCDTQVQLKIPFVSSSNYMNVNALSASNINGSPGIFFLYPYSPLVTASGSTTAEYTLWVHYENVHLMGNVIPQMNRGGKKNKDVLSVEAASSKLVSGTLATISKATGVAANIPGLGAIMGTASWATDILSNAAGAFGFSKPLDLAMPGRMYRSTFPFYMNVDTKAPSLPLALTAGNHVSHVPGTTGPDLDEMTFNYLTSIPTFFSSSSWALTDAETVKVASFLVKPATFYYALTDGTQSLNCQTTVNYVGNYFKYWRGSIDVTIKFVKTEFHTGRLMAVFRPFSQDTGTPTAAFNDNSYCHKTIIDLREGNEIAINIPYVANTSWIPNTYASGLFTLYVLDALVAPAVVSSAITVLIEISGGKDLHFAGPTLSAMQMVAPLTQQMDTCEMSEKVIGTASLMPETLIHSEVSIGEHITSFRQLLKRGSPILNYASTIYPNIYIAPRICWLAYGSATTPTFAEGYAGTDIFSQMSTIFALNRGGVRITLTGNNAMDDGIVHAALTNQHSGYYTFATSITATVQQMLWDTLQQVNAIGTLNTGGIQIDVPQYSINHSMACADQLAAGNLSVPNNKGLNPYAVNIRVGSSVALSYSLWRAGTDDCSFSYFVSIPPTINPSRP